MKTPIGEKVKILFQRFRAGSRNALARFVQLKQAAVPFIKKRASQIFPLLKKIVSYLRSRMRIIRIQVQTGGRDLLKFWKEKGFPRLKAVIVKIWQRVLYFLRLIIALWNKIRPVLREFFKKTGRKLRASAVAFYGKILTLFKRAGIFLKFYFVKMLSYLKGKLVYFIQILKKNYPKIKIVLLDYAGKTVQISKFFFRKLKLNIERAVKYSGFFLRKLGIQFLEISRKRAAFLKQLLLKAAKASCRGFRLFLHSLVRFSIFAKKFGLHFLFLARKGFFIGAQKTEKEALALYRFLLKILESIFRAVRKGVWFCKKAAAAGYRKGMVFLKKTLQDAQKLFRSFKQKIPMRFSSIVNFLRTVLKKLSLIIKISSENFTVLLNKMGKGIIAFLADSGRIIRNGLKKIRYTSRYIVNLLFKALQRTLAETRKALAGAAAILRQLGKLVKKEFLRIFHFFRFCIGTIYKNRRRIFSSVNLLFHIWPRKLLLFGILLIDFLLFLLHFGVAKGIHWFHRLIIKTGKGIYLTGKGIFYFLGRVERAVFRILSIPALAMALILQNLWISSKWLAGLFKKTGQKIYFLIKQILKILFSGGRAFFASSKKILIRGFSAVVSFLGLPGKALVFLFSRAWKWLLLGNRKISRFSNRILKFAGRGFSLFNFSQWGKNTLQQGRKTAFNTGKFILQLRYYAVLFLAGNIRRFIRKTANYLRGIFYLFRLLDWGRASLRVAIKRIFLGIRFRFRLGSGARSFYVFFIKKLIRIFHRIFNVCAFFFGAVKWGLKRLLKSWKRIRWVLKRLRGSAKALVKVARNLFRLRDFTIRFSRSWIKFLNIYRLGRKLESRGMSRIKKAFTRCVKLDQNVKQKTISGLRLFFRVFLFYYRKIFFFFKAENWGLREILKALRKSLKWQIRSLFSMQFVQKRIVKTAKFCVSMARFLEKLAHWKFRSVNRIHSRKESYGKRVENRIKFLLRLKIKLIRSLILTNWLKKGYQLSILLIISLTLYSFTRYPGLWKRQETLAEKKAVFPKVKVALDIKEKSLIEQLTVNLSPEIEITPEKKEGDFILSDRYEKNSVPVYFKGAAIVVHGENPLKNLSLLQLQNILNRKTVRWDAIGWKDIPVEIYVDRSIDFMKFQPSENFLLSNMETIRQRLKTRKGALVVVALKNLDLSLKPVMVDYAYPTRSQIFLKQYPLGKFAVLKKVPGSGVALEKIVKHFPPVPFKSIMAGGDVIWDRGVANSIARNGVSYLIEDLKPLFKTADIAFANLENPVSIRGDKYNLDKGIFFRANPAYMNILTDMGINLVSLSNNHMFDYGMTAALDTVHHLNQNKIHYVGFGLNREEAARGKTYELGSRKIKFMGYNTVYPYNVDAKENTPGILMVNHETLKKEIRKAKKGTDYLIIAIHSGKEYDYYPEKEKQELYRKMIDYGADIILGSHPHVTQTIEYYKNKPIVYSTGNLLFDQYRFSKTRDEMVVELNFYKGRLISLSPHFFKVNSQFKPVAVRNRDVEFLLSRIHKLNDDIKISQKKKEEKVGN